jgi:hypothetical protein
LMAYFEKWMLIAHGAITNVTLKWYFFGTLQVRVPIHYPP